MATGESPVKAARYQNPVVDELLQRDSNKDLSRINQRLLDYVNREPVSALRAIDIKVPQVTFPEGQDLPEINATEFEISHLRSAMASHG